MCLKLGEIKLKKKRILQIKTTNVFKPSWNSNIVIPDEFKLYDSVKSFIGYKNGGTVTPLCNILPQMSGFIKYFEKKTKNISFLAADVMVLKFNKIWKRKWKSYLVLNLIVRLLMIKN